MKGIRTFLLLSLWVLVLGCSTISVRYDYNTETDFARLKTFQWLPVPIRENMDELNVRRIQKAVSNELVSKGYQITEDNPDVLIAMHITTKQRINVSESGYTYGPRGRYWGGRVGPRTLDIYEYEEGTLVLDFVDAGSRELIWRGTASDQVEYYRHANPDKRDQRINRGVREILKNFPPESSKK